MALWHAPGGSIANVTALINADPRQTLSAIWWLLCCANSAAARAGYRTQCDSLYDCPILLMITLEFYQDKLRGT